MARNPQRKRRERVERNIRRVGNRYVVQLCTGEEVRVDSLEEARAARTANDTTREEAKAALAARGKKDASKQERDVCLKLVEVAKERGHMVCVLNDFVRADVSVMRASRGDATTPSDLPLQVKTSHRKADGRFKFGGMHGYNGMPVLLVGIEKDETLCIWILDGGQLDKQCKGADLCFTRDPPEDYWNMSFKSLAEAVNVLATGELMCAWTLCSLTYLSWDFKGDAHNAFVERITLHQFMKTHPGATFPEAQNGPYDLLDAGKRLQFKHCSLRVDYSGFRANLHKRDGKKTVPYASTDWDVLVVMHVLWTYKKVLVWEIPNDKLKTYMSGDTCKGVTSIYVHAPNQIRIQYNLGPAPHVAGDGQGRCKKCKALWTREHCSLQELADFPVEAENAAARFFAHYHTTTLM